LCKPTICGFPVSTLSKPTKLEESTTSCRQYDPVEVIAGLRCAPLEREQKKQPKNSNKTAKKNICVHTACAPTPRKPQAICHFSSEAFRKKSKNKKVQKFSIIRFFRLFKFSIFVRLFEQKSPELQTFRPFEFSSFRLFAVKNRGLHGVTVTSQKSTQWNFW